MEIVLAGCRVRGGEALNAFKQEGMPTMNTVHSMATRASRTLASSEDRPISVRLDVDRLNDLAGLAEIDGTNAAEQIRLAVTAYVKYRRHQPDLEDQIEAAVLRFRSALNGLQGDQQESLLSAPDAPPRVPDTEKSVTLRVAQVSVEYLTSLALLDNLTIADEIRAAVDAYISSRRQDPCLNERVQSARAARERRFARLVGKEAS